MFQLRLVQPDDQGPDPTDLYVRDFLETFVLKECLAKAAPGTVKWYRTTVSYFEAALCQLPPPPKQKMRRVQWTRERDKLRAQGCGDPKLPSLWEQGATTIRTFACWLDEKVPESNTRRTHLQNLQFILRRAGPKRGKKGAFAELFDEDPPEVELPELIIRDVIDLFTLPELGSYLDACEVARWRKKSLPMPAQVFMRNLALFDYNVGLRIGTLLAARHDWRRDDEYGCWLEIPPSAMKGKKRGLVVYLNRHAVAIMERMRSLGDERIFPYPCAAGHLDRLRRQILEASNIPAARHEKLGFHALRKACGTQLARFSLLASKLQLGHGGRRDVTTNHYIHRETVLPEPCERLPQPRWDGRQKRLF